MIHKWTISFCEINISNEIFTSITTTHSFDTTSLVYLIRNSIHRYWSVRHNLFCVDDFRWVFFLISCRLVSFGSVLRFSGLRAGAHDFKLKWWIIQNSDDEGGISWNSYGIFIVRLWSGLWVLRRSNCPLDISTHFKSFKSKDTTDII